MVGKKDTEIPESGDGLVCILSLKQEFWARSYSNFYGKQVAGIYIENRT
jgi:hypothetical protein